VARFPQSFVDDVRAAADIVQVIQDVVPLRRVGGRYVGLCPFHSEKTPSFQVNRERGFFHCFGCKASGDVFKFVELQDKLGFLEAVRMLAQRFGVPVPSSNDPSEVAADAERETLLKMHELAVTWFQQQLTDAIGAKARNTLTERGLKSETIERLRLGYAPLSRDGLKRRLLKEGFGPQVLVKGGLVAQREDGSTVDRFRNRLMIPIARESGSVVAFGGRALDEGYGPKYLNSPETPIYHKGNVLYGLHITKQDMRQTRRAVLVEGYFDFAQAVQGGLTGVVATCGTALTAAQAQIIRRFADSAVLSFDPDAAGRGAAARSCDVLVEQGLEVRVALLPAGRDPDVFVREQGGDAYRDLIDRAGSWLDYLIEQAAERHPPGRPQERPAFLREMLEVAARIPDAAARDQFADRVAHRSQITEEVVRSEIRRAAVARRTTVPAAGRWVASTTELKPAERDLLTALVREPGHVVPALVELEDEDLTGLRSAGILRMFRTAALSGTLVPGALLERLDEEEGRLMTALATAAGVPASPTECVRALRAIRLQRERAGVQREIDRLQELGADQHSTEIATLWQRKKDLMRRLEALDS